MKRLGIFFFYEKNGDVDDFITYYLRDLARNLTELIVVCNGKLSKQGRAAFEEFTDQIIVRENKGLDVWAYKTALDQACGFVIIAADSRREGRTCRIKSAAAAAADMTGFSAVLAGYGELSALVTV